jgi:hypothetical protein
MVVAWIDILGHTLWGGGAPTDSFFNNIYVVFLVGLLRGFLGLHWVPVHGVNGDHFPDKHVSTSEDGSEH